MHRTRDRSNGLLFDPWASLEAKRRRMLDDSWAGVFRHHLLSALPVRALTTGFSAGMGRPTKDLHVAAGVLILQQLHDLTDAAALSSFGLLQRVLAEQFEIAEAGDSSADDALVRVKEPKEIPCDNLRNPAAPDSSYNKHRGQGYLAQVMETYQEDDAAQDEQAQSMASEKPDR